MRAYIIRRVLLIIPNLFIVAMIIFLLVQLIPGSVIENMLAQMEFHYQERDIEAIKESLGINVPLYVQFGRWVGDFVRGDLGTALWTGRPVLEELTARIPVSAELSLLAMSIAMLIALPIGVYSAIRQDTGGDYVGRSIAIIFISVPSFWIGTMVMVYPSIWLNWTPSMEYIPLVTDLKGNLVQFIIPATVLGMVLSGTTMRMMRTMMLEVLRQDYIRTAWAKGLTERVVIMRHAMKNALIPVITVAGVYVTMIVGGSVIMEQIFVLPGLGRYLLEAIEHRDYIALAGVNMFIATAVLIINLLVDLTYGFLDPRIRYQ